MSRTNKRFGWRRDLPDQRDFFLPTLVRSKKRLPKSVDLRPGFEKVPMYDQGSLGSCTANAIAAAILYTEIKEKNDQSLTYPSRLFIYYNEREMEGTIESDSGAEIRDGMKAVAKLGYPQEDSWPYIINRFAMKPGAVIYTEAKKDHIIRYYRVPQTVRSLRICLAHGYPFVFGFTVYENFWDSENNGGHVPMAAGGIEGGHAVIACGYDDDKRQFLWRNSWGESYGDSGYGTIPYEYVANNNLADDFWTIRKETT